MSVEISGALLCSLLNAGNSLKLIIPDGETRCFAPDAWYPLQEFETILESASQYKNHEPILVQIGIEMMKSWYSQGPGSYLIFSGLDFLHLQTGSQGYRSVVKGPMEGIGSFDLLDLNEAGGTAHIVSSTLFPIELERGILAGGLGLVGDLLYYDVKSIPGSRRLDIRFVTKQNKSTLSWRPGGLSDERDWKLKHLENQMAEKEKFWDSINQTLNAAYREMREALSRVKMLSGLLPICASCKKIRDDKGYWNQIETYIAEHSEAEFSHGLCPECARRLYPG